MKSSLSVVAVLTLALFTSCASDQKAKNLAKESAAKYWQDKAYPGKAFDVQVIEAEKADDGMYRVKGIIDGETRTGMFNPETESFSEGFYSLSKERNKRIAELEQEVKYWKEKSEAFEKENYKFRVRLKLPTGDKTANKKPADAAADTDSDSE